MKEYIKPEINEEFVEIEDVIAVSCGTNGDINSDTHSYSVKDIFNF